MRSFALLSVLLMALVPVFGARSEPCPDASEARTVPERPPGLERLRMGGSNYISYGDIRAYHASMHFSKAENRYRFDTSILRPVIATYHLSPRTVETQLRRIRQSGQQMVSLFLWYANVMSGSPAAGYRGHVVFSNGGKLQPRQRDNLRAVLQLVRRLNFTRLVFRLGPQGANMPYYWKTMRERIFQDSLGVTESVVATARHELAGSNVELLVDLGAENAGNPRGKNREFIQRIWRRICAIYSDCEDGFFFSFNPVWPKAERRIALFHQWIMEANGRLPKYWAFDVYGYGGGQGKPVKDWDVYRQLVDVFTEMRKIGQAENPFILQEVFYDDPRTAADIRRFMRDYPVWVESIFQWPNSREVYQRFFEKGTRNFAAVDFPASYCAYAALTPPVAVVSTGRTLVRVDRAGCSRRGETCRVRLEWSAASALVVVREAAGAVKAAVIGCGRAGEFGLDAPVAPPARRISVYRRTVCEAPSDPSERPVQTLEIRWN